MSVSSLAPAVVGLFREPAGFEQVAAGGGTAIKLVQIGGEEGRVLEPSAFDAAPDGTFVVADAPNGRERVQVFNARGDLFSTFRLPGRANARVAIGALALNGVGTLAYTGESVVMNQPESGWFITEYGVAGPPAFRKFDATGALVDERTLQGREIDPVVMSLPQRWPRRTVGTTEVPRVTPIVRAVQLRGAGILSPASLSLAPGGRLPVAPGCYEFGPG